MRRQGFIPAVVYGPESESMKLSVKREELLSILRKGSIDTTLIDLEISNGRESTKKVVLIRDLQRDYLSLDYLHVDFYEVPLDKKITVEVPIVFVGKPIGVAKGGIMEQLRRRLAIECLPGDIPEHIEIDISELDIGDSIHVEDVSLPPGVTSAEEANYAIVTVTAPTVEEEVEEEEVEEAAEEKEEEEREEKEEQEEEE